MDLSGWVTAAGSGWAPNDWILSFTGESADDPTISTGETFGNVAFVFDVRLRPDSHVATVFLRGGEQTALELDVGDPEMAEHFAEVGQWNRFEGTLRDDLLSLSLNGQQLFEDRQLIGAPEHGPMTIEAAGPTDFANFYVRVLE